MVGSALKLATFFIVVSKMKAASKLPSILPTIIMEHFSSIGSCNAYFCTFDDASYFKRELSFSSTLFMMSVILTTNDRISLDSSQHRLGIFVDTNCLGGMRFLQQNGGMFNSSYRWLLWSKDSAQVVDNLKPSRLDVDSDLTLLTEIPNTADKILEVDTSNGAWGSNPGLGVSFAMIDVHRKHRSSPFIMEEYQRWIGNNALSISPLSDRRDLSGLQFIGSVLLPNLNTANLPRDLLVNPAHAFNVDVKWRYGISLFLTICQHYLNCSFPIGTYNLHPRHDLRKLHYPTTYQTFFDMDMSIGWATVDLLQAKCNDESSLIPCNGTAGVIDQVSKGEVDFGIVPLAWDLLKSEIIDYSLPIMNIKHKYLFLRPKMIGSSDALIRPLSTEVWVLLFVLMIFSVFAFRAVSSYDDSSRHNDGWGGSLFLFVSALAQQGIPDNAGTLTTKIVYICTLGVTFFVFVYYSTALLNSLLLPPPHSISFPWQLFASHLEVGLEESPFLRARMAQNADRDEELKDKLAGNAESDVFMEVVTGVERAAREPFAIFGDELALYQQLWKMRFTYAETCSIGLVNDCEHPKQASFVMRTNSPYKEILRRGIIRSRERGALHRLKTEWFLDLPECLWKTDALQFGLQPHSVAYVIMAVGLLASIIIFSVEKIKYNPKILRKSKPKSQLVDKTHTE